MNDAARNDRLERTTVDVGDCAVASDTPWPTTRPSVIDRRLRAMAPLALLLLGLTASCQPRACRSNSGCGEGAVCLHGFCVGGSTKRNPVGDSSTATVSTLSRTMPCGAPPNQGELLIQEVLASPGPEDDANGDGVPSTRDDEFIELVNIGPSVLDLDGVSVWLGARLKHRFRQRCLASGRAIVLFSGGSAALSVAGADFLVAEKSLSIANDGVTVTLHSLDGRVIDTAIVPKLPVGHSGVRPLDGQSLLVDHTLAPFSRGRAHSVGRCTDGADYPLCVDEQREMRVEPTSDVERGLRP